MEARKKAEQESRARADNESKLRAQAEARAAAETEARIKAEDESRKLRREAPGTSIEWTGPRETMLPELAEGQIDVAIAPAGLRLPDGVSAEETRASEELCGNDRVREAPRKKPMRAASSRAPARRSRRTHAPCA
jgi:hypothetical protein